METNQEMGRTQEPENKQKKCKSNKGLYIIIILLLLILGGMGLARCLRRDVADIHPAVIQDREPVPAPEGTVRYGFDANTQGWIAQTYVDSQAITSVGHTNEIARYGEGSLKCEVELIRLDENKSKGEIFVDMPPVDLENRVVSAWVMVGNWAIDDTIPNGLQIFVKDDSWRSWYSSWQNIEPMQANQWIEVRAVVSGSRPSMGWMDSGFDPTTVRSIGLKIGSGEAGGERTFEGNMYVDSFIW